MKANYILKCLFLITYLNTYLVSDQIPTNNLSNYTLNRWIVIKDDGLNNDKIEELVNDPLSYTKNTFEKRNVNLGEQKDLRRGSLISQQNMIM